jgi:hypothetical protein
MMLPLMPDVNDKHNSRGSPRGAPLKELLDQRACPALMNFQLSNGPLQSITA